MKFLIAPGRPGVLPGAGLLTLEPGGQVELSTAPAKDLSDCVAAASGDLAVLREAFGAAGLTLAGHGIDPSAARAGSSICRGTRPWRSSSTATAPGAGS